MESPVIPPIALYVHIPFCETKCPYCDFNTYARIEPLMPDYVSALDREIQLWGQLLGHPEVRTIFFGGGTPSYLPEGDIDGLMETIGGYFDLMTDAEVTLEANPGDLTPEKLREYRAVGINRLSIGVQTFDDRLLKLLGRRHNSDQAVKAYNSARGAGFDNLSIDLMFGLPDQSLDDWAASLDTAIELEPPHISMYCLTLEEGTPFEAWVRLGKMAEPDPDLAADMYELAMDRIAQAGYEHYEISNWAKSGLESQHNLVYWRTEPYLGVGPGAHSYLGNYRFANLRSPREYVRELEGYRQVRASLRPARTQDSDRVPKELIDTVPVVDTVEAIDAGLAMSEMLMMGLRLSEGVSIEEFHDRFGQWPTDVYPEVVTELTGLGLLRPEDDRLRLTDKGRMLGNEVFARFFE